MSKISIRLTKNLIVEIIRYLEQNVTDLAETRILDLIKSTDLDEQSTNHCKPNPPPKHQSIQNALSSIISEDLLPIKKCISLCMSHLMWDSDAGEFYERNSGISSDYVNGNMNTELIGPNRGVFRNKQLRLGLFLLDPHIFYEDHKHAAPELYLNLSEDTKWRFNDGCWEQRTSGSIIYNKPFRSHAMIVGDAPFLSVWCWPYNSDKKCILLKRNL